MGFSLWGSSSWRCKRRAALVRECDGSGRRAPVTDLHPTVAWPEEGRVSSLAGDSRTHGWYPRCAPCIQENEGTQYPIYVFVAIQSLSGVRLFATP